MLTALKFVAAGVVVALFGGFLLAGVLTQPGGNEAVPGAVTGSPSPMPTNAPQGFFWSLVTEEVEPGVHRLVSDGRLDLTQAMSPGREIATTVIAPDGYAWMFGPETFFRLGSGADIHQWPVGRPGDAGFAPDGDIWATYPAVIRVFDGSDWTTRTVEVTADRIEFAADGKAWAQTWDEDKGTAVIGWFEPDGAEFVRAREERAQEWDVDEEPDPDASFVPSSVAQVGLADGGAWSLTVDGTLDLYRWAVGEWESVSTQPGYGVLGIGPDGTVWMVRCPTPGCWGPWANREEATLARLEGGAWQESARPDHGLAVWGNERVAPDGAIWGPAAPVRDDTCSGIVRFDGEASTRWLDGHCIEAIEIGHDGSAWVQAFERSLLAGSNKTDDGSVETYVILPGT